MTRISFVQLIATLFGPDSQTKRLTAAWDMVRNSLKVQAPKAAPSPSPSPQQ